MPKTEDVANQLEALIEKQRDLVKEARLGMPRKRMFEAVKEIRGDINQLVQDLGSY